MPTVNSWTGVVTRTLCHLSAAVRTSVPRTRAVTADSVSTARHVSSLLDVDQHRNNCTKEEKRSIATKIPTTMNNSLQILRQGLCLSIEPESIEPEKGTEEGRLMVLAASWLWVHDPNSIHPSSGQKLRTLGQYSVDQHRIVQADWVVLPRATTKEHCQNEEEGSSLLSSSSSAPSKLHPPPPAGSYHPRGGVYDTEEESTRIGKSPMLSHHRSLLHIKWADNMESYYDWEWLQQFQYATGNISSATPSPTKITSHIAIGAKNNPRAVPIPTLEYDFILKTEEGRWKALDGIMEHGAILIRQAPTQFKDEPSPSSFREGDEGGPLESEATVAEMGKCLSGGRLSHGSLYGDTFRVISQPNAHNIAYTSVALPPHQDLAYYESKPFLQLLHCVSNAPNGGASVLIDAMAAAEYLRIVAPDLFDTLCRVEATFVKQRQGADMVSFKPHIVISHHDDGEVVEVNWSPPFEGPLMMMFTEKEETKIEDMEDYVRAYQAMECLLNNDRHPQYSHHPSVTEAFPASSLLISTELQKQLSAYANNYTWEHVLEPGDILVFNNQRMCHGRRAFELEEVGSVPSSPSSSSSVYHSPRRHLIGCYGRRAFELEEVGSVPSSPSSSSSVYHSPRRHLIGCYTDAMDTVNEYRLLQRNRYTNYPRQWGMRNVGNGTRASRI